MPDRRVVLVEATEIAHQALARSGEADYWVIHFTDGRYVVIKPLDLRRKLAIWKMLDRPLEELPPQAFAGNLAATIQLGDAAFQERLHHLEKDEPLVVLAGDRFVALYIGGQTLRGAPSLSEAIESPAGSVVAGDVASAAPEKRFVNIELHDAAGRPLDPAAKPLSSEQVYRLIFDVDVELRPNAIARKGAEFAYSFEEGEQLVKITVRLESQDFEFFGEQEQTLLVPRMGKSKNQATFSMQPLHDGECQINAVLLKEGNFIQVIVLKFVAGEALQVQTLGRSVEAAFEVQPRDVSLTILNTGATFQIILISPGVGATAFLPIKLAELHDMALQARQQLMAVVNLEQDGQYPFQYSIDIPPSACQFALRQLAEVGFRLYQRIFFGPSADEQVKNLGRKLRQLAQKEKLKIQVFSQDFVLPWGLLYLAERFDPDRLDPELFLGLKHIIEHIPLQQSLQVTDPYIPAANGLAVSLNVNADIDRDTSYPLVSSQLEYWNALQKSGARLAVITRQTAREVAAALSDPATPDQVLYFYCHGASQEVNRPGSMEASTLVLSGGGSLTLKDLNLYAPPEDQLPNAPLVFINACESAQLSPLVYDGFVPYFMSKGARGVIGTEVETPALFAVEWAKRFFDRFLKGETVGEIFLALRREFYDRHRNLMGLLYALYLDGDTCLKPAVV